MADGKIKHIGLSNYAVWRIVWSWWRAGWRSSLRSVVHPPLKVDNIIDENSFFFNPLSIFQPLLSD